MHEQRFLSLFLAACAALPLLAAASNAQTAPQIMREQTIGLLLEVPQEEHLEAATAEAIGGDEEPHAFARPQVDSSLKWRLEAEDPEAAWVRLHFDPESRLDAGSYLTITSVADGSHQTLTAEDLEAWSHSTAYFQGHAVEVELHAGEDSGTALEILSMSVGEGHSEAESGCGTEDNRFASSDPRVGRISPEGCTGWLIANGAVLTAGHCVGMDMDILEFNVPPSKPNGKTVPAAVVDQYPIDKSSVRHQTGAPVVGNDWAIFRVGPNSQTGLLPAQAQGDFFRIAQGNTPSSVQVTGFGLDDEPLGTSGATEFLNHQNQTQQTDIGAFKGREVPPGAAKATLRHRVDTEKGNSGSPIIDTDTGVAFGIHTSAGCGVIEGANHGTAFENQKLKDAILHFTGSPTLFVDPDHPSQQADGTIFRPFKSIAEALTSATEGTTVLIAPGQYPEESLPVTEGVTLSTPAGPVTLGAPTRR